MNFEREARTSNGKIELRLNVGISSLNTHKVIISTRRHEDPDEVIVFCGDLLAPFRTKSRFEVLHVRSYLRLIPYSARQSFYSLSVCATFFPFRYI